LTHSFGGYIEFIPGTLEGTSGRDSTTCSTSQADAALRDPKYTARGPDSIGNHRTTFSSGSSFNRGMEDLSEGRIGCSGTRIVARNTGELYDKMPASRHGSRPTGRSRTEFALNYCTIPRWMNRLTKWSISALGRVNGTLSISWGIFADLILRRAPVPTKIEVRSVGPE
jgi:hypothetical protein